MHRHMSLRSMLMWRLHRQVPSKLISPFLSTVRPLSVETKLSSGDTKEEPDISQEARPGGGKVYLENCFSIRGVVTSPCRVNRWRDGEFSGCDFLLKQRLSGKQNSRYVVISRKSVLSVFLLNNISQGCIVDVVGNLVRKRSDPHTFMIRAFKVDILQPYDEAKEGDADDGA